MRALAVLAAIALAAGCAGPQAQATDRTVSLVLYQKPKLFSPLAANWGPDQQVMSLIYQSLMTTDPDLKVVPQLASKLDVSPDATRFTFTLTQGLKWSDGAPFSSADVLFTHKLLADPAARSYAAGFYRDATLSAPDPSTFVITTKTPNYGIVAQVATYPILPRHILGDKPVGKVADDPFFMNPTVGLGPFQFVTYKTDQYVELKANPHFRAPVGLDRVFLRTVTSDVVTAQLSTGEVDVAAVSPADRGALGSRVDFAASKDGGFVRIGLNLTRPQFADPRVRQALLHGINREAIVASALPGVGKVRNSSFDPSVSGAGISSYAFSQDKARELLTAAGWDFGRTVRLAWVPVGNPDRDAAALAVQSQLGEIGVRVELQKVDSAWATNAIKTMDYDMYLFGGGNYASDPWSVNAIVGCQTHSPVGGNIVRFCDQDLDKKMAEANATTDAAARLARYTEAATMDNARVPYLWLYSFDGTWAVNKRVKNFQPLYPAGGPFWKAENWTVS